MKVPEVVRRMACGTSLMSYSPPKPTVSPFIRVTLSCSLMTIWPFQVSWPGCPW